MTAEDPNPVAGLVQQWDDQTAEGAGAAGDENRWMHDVLPAPGPGSALAVDYRSLLHRLDPAPPVDVTAG
ncbi:hypothetical protein GCM10009541_57480 [Micromonospora gifhornensis]|uniref:Uncharacterized protein n=1 Tax=Micromonospora gifhornensis TaxID=84594 RepID=A0ABQ4IJ66_9ACTN|nr:hypothetical protein Vgi01_46400 [Micromonospora gifhornensis]